MRQNGFILHVGAVERRDAFTHMIIQDIVVELSLDGQARRGKMVVVVPIIFVADAAIWQEAQVEKSGCRIGVAVIVARKSWNLGQARIGVERWRAFREILIQARVKERWQRSERRI